MSEFENNNCKTKKILNNIPNITPRGGASMIQCDNYILLFGGANRQQEHYNDIHLCTKQNDSFKWEKIISKGDIPPPRSGHSMCQFGNYIFLFGGIDFENEAIYNDLYMLNTVTWEWKYVGEAGEEISPRNSHTLNILHINSIPYLVLYGGASPELGPLGDSYYAVLPKDGITDITDSNSSTENTTEFFVTWKKINSTPSPSPREMFSSSIYQNSLNTSSLIIAGGRTIDAILSDVWILTGRYLSTQNNNSNTPTVENTSTTIETINNTNPNDNTNPNNNINPNNISETNNTEFEVVFEWQQLLSYELPHPRCAHTSWIFSTQQSTLNTNEIEGRSISDNLNFEMVIFGGFTGQGISDDIIYSRFNSNITSSSSNTTSSSSYSSPSSRWIPLETSQTIPGRFGHVICQSPSWIIPKKQQKSISANSTILLYGGIDAEQDYNDLWMISLPNNRTI